MVERSDARSPPYPEAVATPAEPLWVVAAAETVLVGLLLVTVALF